MTTHETAASTLR